MLADKGQQGADGGGFTRSVGAEQTENSPFSTENETSSTALTLGYCLTRFWTTMAFSSMSCLHCKNMIFSVSM